MKRFGLIGHPIAHSLSPALFKAGYDDRYPYELIESDDFEEAYARFLQEYDAVNVTAPFKELAFRRADILSEECRRIGATNLLVKTPEGIKAYNSDYLGVRLWLSEVDGEVEKRTPPTPAARGVARFFQPPHQLPITESGEAEKALQRRDTRVSKTFEESRSSDGARDCLSIPACPSGLSQSDWGSDNNPTTLVVGLGGAGKAATEAAKSLGYRTILMNRTRFSEDIRPLEDFCRCFREADIIIYNIPTAIPQLTELTDEDFRGLIKEGRKDETDLQHRPKFILEANYKDPSFDKGLIDKMKGANPLAEYISGKTWLLYQALTGYEIFTGELPDLAKMSAVL